ncbi:CinA family protein [Agromyces salentinus]|uniref:CinA family protein n=1 Tax=Agromyces salentinus TaxID=269421 RepID=A0ABN2MFC7_9MICO|nr:CinA family protein [Agromyces salentinus]
MSNLQERAEAVAGAAKDTGARVAVAESLTSGRIASELGRATDASDWFLGGVVAYDTGVKQQVLGVSPGPVVSARCAIEMAVGVQRLCRADVSVSVTGVGGPGSEEGEPEGTVFLGWATADGTGSERHRFDGDPSEVVEQTVAAALRVLVERLAPAEGSEGDAAE